MSPESPSPTPPSPSDRFLVGTLGAPIGLRGEVRLHPDGLAFADVQLLFEADAALWLSQPSVSGLKALHLRSLRSHGDRLIVAFAEFSDRTALEGLLRGSQVVMAVSEAREVISEEAYLADDFAGCIAFDEENREVGRIDAVLPGPQSLLRIVPCQSWWRERGHSSTAPAYFLLPMVEALVPSVDLASRRLVVRVPPGTENL